MTNKKFHSYYIYIIAVVAATGGLLFGFDTGVISGAIPFFQKDLSIDDNAVELITSSGLIGAILGALFCGKAVDRFGRKKVILLSAAIFVVGALWSGAAGNMYSLIFARMFLGIAIGISSFVVPLYIAEISPAKYRGRLVAMFQLMITIGILASYFSDLLFADEQHLSCWRPMFYVGVFPALVLLSGMYFMPESPRWLLSRGENEKSRSILARIESPDTFATVWTQMETDIRADKQNASRWKELFRPWLRTPLMIAVFIMFFQQFIGINTVIYYSPKIFLMAGFDSAISAIWASAGVGVVNVCFTILSLFIIDRWGRRKLYFAGFAGIAVSLLALSACFLFSGQLDGAGKWLSIALMFLYIAFFAVSMGPLAWLIVSEVFPQRVRGLGTSLGSLSVWLFNTLVTFTFFKIVQALSFPEMELTVEGESTGNPAGAFALYALVAIAGLIWGYFYLPETKGVSLEKIEEHWRKGLKARDLKNNFRNSRLECTT
ncbi:MAG: sugar porter family MFS transporter [Bacteroidales bacterium]|jgi:sugar porter (SP) family MFS transporter|nr:sugar porter family MFS transporter [Bacteroidales bacterium]